MRTRYWRKELLHFLASGWERIDPNTLDIGNRPNCSNWRGLDISKHSQSIFHINKCSCCLMVAGILPLMLLPLFSISFFFWMKHLELRGIQWVSKEWVDKGIWWYLDRIRWNKDKTKKVPLQIPAVHYWAQTFFQHSLTEWYDVLYLWWVTCLFFQEGKVDKNPIRNFLGDRRRTCPLPEGDKRVDSRHNVWNWTGSNFEIVKSDIEKKHCEKEWQVS